MAPLVIPNIAEQPAALSAVTQSGRLHSTHFTRMDVMYRYWYVNGQGVRGEFAVHPDVKNHSMLTNGERRALGIDAIEWD